MRRVTTAFTTISPRAEDTRTLSPVLMPSFCASDTGSSIIGSGTSSLSHGMLRVVEPGAPVLGDRRRHEHVGKVLALPIGWCDSTRGYLSIGLCRAFGCSAFATGLSTGS